jgi:hypothetical protein
MYAALAQHLWTYIATFLNVQDHLICFAPVCTTLYKAARSPSSWQYATLRHPHIGSVRRKCLRRDDCPIKRHLYRRETKQSRLLRHLVSSGLVQLVTKYNYCPGWLDLSDVYHVPTTIALLEALAEAPLRLSRRDGVQQLVLYVRDIDDGFVQVWETLAKLASLHTLVLAGEACGTSVRNPKLSPRTDELVRCGTPLPQVKRVMLVDSCLTIRKDYDAAIIRWQFPRLKKLHWTESSAMIRRQGQRTLICQRLEDVAYEICNMQFGETMGVTKYTSRVRYLEADYELFMTAADGTSPVPVWSRLIRLKLLQFRHLGPVDRLSWHQRTTGFLKVLETQVPGLVHLSVVLESYGHIGVLCLSQQLVDLTRKGVPYRLPFVQLKVSEPFKSLGDASSTVNQRETVLRNFATAGVLCMWV